jgi:hypothetical protein
MPKKIFFSDGNINIKMRLLLNIILTQVANYRFVIQQESTAVLWIGISAVDSY